MGINWVISGGCGFIGTSLVKRLLLDEGNNIRVVDNLSIGSREDLARVCDFAEYDPSDFVTADLLPFSHSVELIAGDILDADLAFKVSQGADIVVHLAANTGVEASVQDPRFDCENNVMGVINYLEAARANGIKRFVFASSGASVGECEPPIHEEIAPHPASPYGASKLAGEAYCSAYFRTFGLETVVLRFGNVYGPGSGHKNSAVARFIRQAMRGEPLEIYGDGWQTRDFIYITDLVQTITLAAEIDGIGGETFQIATNSETSVKDLVDDLIAIIGHYGFQGVEVYHGESRQGDVRRSFSDTSKARRVLGWQVEVDLMTGLRQTVEWFIKESTIQV